MARVSLVALAGLLLLGCGDDSRPPADARPDKKRQLDVFIVPELAPDWIAAQDTSPPTCDPTSIGKFCTRAADCDEKLGMECLGTTSDPFSGVCACRCQPDDPKTTSTNEDNCPAAQSGKNKCVTVPLQSGGKTGFCMRTCKPKTGSSDCPAGVACDPYSTVIFDLSQPVCALAGCTKAADCPVSTATVCSVAAKNCPTGETCLAVVSGLDEGRCYRPGKCDLASGLCDAHDLGKATAAVGDPCQSDLDCAGNQRCIPEVDESRYYRKSGAACSKDSECCSRNCDPATLTCTKAVCTVLRRHGYCTIAGCEFADTLTIRACPAGSACNLRFYTGYCQKTCDMTKPGDCRGQPGELYGDYECRRWGNLSSYMKTNVPVCDFGTGLRCSFFAGSSYDCSILRADAPPATTNPTDMKCRTLDGKDAPGGKHDPTGFCLDNTGSGTAYRDPMPTP
jgi:hypothetical protein